MAYFSLLLAVIIIVWIFVLTVLIYNYLLIKESGGNKKECLCNIFEITFLLTIASLFSVIL